VKQFHAACSHGGEKDFDGRHLLARTAILDRTVDDEVMIARVAEDSTEHVGGAGADFILAKGCGHRRVGHEGSRERNGE
jgi:hypothetical protein